MRQNRSITSQKKHRNQNIEINSLTNSLFDKIDYLTSKSEISKPRPSSKRSQQFLLPRFDDLQTITLNNSSKQTKNMEPLTILQKAKLITNEKKHKIQKAKMMYKKSNPETQGMFLTGCGLYRAQQPKIIHNQDYESVDMNDALKFLVFHQKDDLQQLRKMIKKTSFHIKQYSHECKVNKTKNKIVSAADIFGKQMNSDLRMKISKHKPLQSDFCQFQQNLPKRKISTAINQRQKNIY